MDLKNFVLLKGNNVTVENGRIKFKPRVTRNKNQDTKAKTSKAIQTVLLRSDVTFQEGTIELKFKFTEPSSGILLVLNSQADESYVIGHSGLKKQFVLMDDWSLATPEEAVNGLENFKVGDPVHMKISVSGSKLSLYVNNVFLFQSNLNVKSSPIELRLSSYKSIIEVYDFKVVHSKPILFVVMQFSKEYNDLYNDVIKPVVEDFGFSCIRADEFYTTSPILKDIIENIETSKAIIAEITPDNPNVFYEIGYSHAIKKPTILLCDHKREKLPFDISSFRTLFYENSIGGKRKVEESLIKYLEQIK